MIRRVFLADESAEYRIRDPGGLVARRCCRRVGVLCICILVTVSFCGRAAYCDQPTSETADGAFSASDRDFFESKVRPLLVEHCYECHANGETDGGLSLDSRVSILRGGDSGAAVVPGDPQRSRLIRAIRYDDPSLQMPPQNRLSPRQVAVLEDWVARGMPDPRTGEMNRKPVAGMSIEEGKSFWSMRPLRPQWIPDIDDDRVRTPIDAFIFDSLNKANLPPAPPADRRTLIRRIKLDLTGLPPTADEVSRLLADPSPGAIDRYIEQLMDSPQYGERWGRHWLDVVRYADSNGLDENLAFGNAWRYRDYVIESFNQDKPFDRFMIEQIAGDLLPDVNETTLTATGFLVLGAKVLAEPDREKLAMDTIDEQIDATGKVFLGLTLGCARCHDHKFDPIKQSDYYALAAVFKSTRTFADTATGAIKHWHEHVFATPEQLEQFKQLDSEIAAKKSAASKFKNQAIARLREEARDHAAEYLAAATQFSPDASLNTVQKIAQAHRLHPRILHHCRLHLKYHADDPLFAPWYRMHREFGEAAVEPVARHYGDLFKSVRKALSDARRENPKATTLTDETLESARVALYDNAGFLAVPPKPEFAFDDATLRQYNELMEQARLFESHAADVPAAMGVKDGEIVVELPIHIRGSHLNLGQPVPRAIPEVLRGEDEIAFPEDQSGRLQLAQWMASPGNPLTARVYVNRVWRWHFGQGLVATTENFGVLGQRPSHPELLDWLADYFIQSGWSTKALNRLIMRSYTYQMASTHPNPQPGLMVDPDNRWLWRFRLQRMDAEQIRDAMLAISGQLDPALGGKSVPLRNRQFVFNHTSEDHTKYDSLRRAVYLPVIRNHLYSWFEQFDFPDPAMPSGDRHQTVTPAQSLLLMNSDLVLSAAESVADGLLQQAFSDRSRIEQAYVQILNRNPSAEELQRALEFLDSEMERSWTRSDSVDDQARRQAWALLCQSLMVCNEFLYVR